MVRKNNSSSRPPWFSIKWLVLWSLWAARLVRQPTAPVVVSNGVVRGSIAPDGTAAHYLGIPYATVIKRFQNPGPEPKWEGTYEAINENIRCLQIFGEFFIIGRKDCLTLNVYAPLHSRPDSRLPVMVFIHGGAFFKGSGNGLTYGPKYLVTKDVILVTLNYRLHILGFLCLRLKEAPGNVGMKDQVAALRWVQRNIRKFGGDPDNVTIFGESAGGSSVSYHVISPMSRGLFHKAITQSGSSLSPWGYKFDPVSEASRLAEEMSHDTQDAYELYQLFLSKTEAELILTRVPRQNGSIVISEILFAPCAETPTDGVESFLTESPYEILTKGEHERVPMIIGTNNEEGLLMLTLDFSDMIEKVEIGKSLPADLNITSKEELEVITRKLNTIYLEDHLNATERLINLSRWYGEPYLVLPSLEETEILINSKDTKSIVFNYLFQYNGWRNTVKVILSSVLRKVPGATHGDELFYIFSQHFSPVTLESGMVEKMSTMWTNFAKYGDPTPEVTPVLPVKWLPSTSTSPSSLVIDTEFHMGPLWFNDRLKYLREIYSKHRRKR